MTASLLVKRCLLAGALACSLSAMAADEAAPSLTLSFNRTGTDVASVTVTTAGIEGVTATLTDASPIPFKAACNEVALCPDVNAKADPTIIFEFSITGLPADFTFNQVQFKTHAYNASAGNQQPSDGKNRYYNIDIEANSTLFASKIDQDIAKENESGHLYWDVTAANAFTATSPLTLKLTITKGSDNQGCFFGLEEVTLQTASEGQEPEPVIPPVDPSESKIYTISWKAAGSLYMTQTAGGAIQALQSSTKNMQYWEFIPTGNENCYYIRNLASGKYIDSCNKEPASASTISVTDTPVEYYVGKTASTAAEIANCYWLSSTDCANHNNETNNARALNKDGASSNIITWTNGAAKTGSYWTLTETENLYEPQPFTPSNEIGKPLGIYHLLNAQGQSYSAEGNWEPLEETDNHRWYFVGSSNENGGYQIVSVKNHTAVNSGAQHTIADAPTGNNFYQFFNGENALELNGANEFKIAAAHSDFALNNQIYNMPCGSMGSTFITKVSIGEDFHYPMAQVSGSNITYPAAGKPGNKYVILSKDAAIVEKGTATPISISLNLAPSANTTVTLFIDWNRDGVFEYSQPLESAQEMQAEITAPGTAENGFTRARIRLTDNGTTGAEEDVHGEILDLRLDVTDASSELLEPIVKVNDPKRGKAEWADGTATATPKGDALFLYWLDGKRIASVSSNYEVAASSTPRELTAVFSINTKTDDEDDNKGDDNKGDEDALAQIELASGCINVEGNTLSVESEFEVKHILVFALNGNLAVSADSTTEVTVNLPAGIYIAKAITAGGTITAKIQL